MGNDLASILTATHWPNRVDSPGIIAANHSSVSWRAEFGVSERPKPGGGQRGLLPKQEPAEILRSSSGVGSGTGGPPQATEGGGSPCCTGAAREFGRGNLRFNTCAILEYPLFPGR